MEKSTTATAHSLLPIPPASATTSTSTTIITTNATTAKFIVRFIVLKYFYLCKFELWNTFIAIPSGQFYMSCVFCFFVLDFGHLGKFSCNHL